MGRETDLDTLFAKVRASLDLPLAVLFQKEHAAIGSRALHHDRHHRLNQVAHLDLGGNGPSRLVNRQQIQMRRSKRIPFALPKRQFGKFLFKHGDLPGCPPQHGIRNGLP